MDILDNMVLWISGEEEEMGPETSKILGHVNRKTMSFIQRSDLKVSSTYTRRPSPSAEQVRKAMRDYVSDAQRLGCPSAPDPAITILKQLNRPHPRLDRM
ncbi:MAG: hypothetical protein Q9161_007219 [Pseudevernia consocians]